MSIKNELMNFLTSEGLAPKEENFGIYFKYQMLNFFIQWDEGDERFLKIDLPNIFDVNENNKMEALLAANVVNCDRKVVKAFIVNDDSIWISAEQLLDTNPEYSDVIPRTLNMILQARDYFYQKIKSL